MFKDIKEYVESEKKKIAEAIEKSDIQPKIMIIQVGDNEASNRYVRNKIRDCAEVGIIAKLRKFSDLLGFAFIEVSSLIVEEADNYDAIMIQLPLMNFDKAESNYVIGAIPIDKDVDGLVKESEFIPCTARGVMDYLKYCDFDFEGKHAVVIGRSELAGRPIANLLTDANATVTLCHSKTKNLSELTSMADLIICAVGKPNFLNCYPLHCPIIDVGTNIVNGKLVGDCFNTENREVTPVPGGVGLLTRLALLKNICDATGIKY